MVSPPASSSFNWSPGGEERIRKIKWPQFYPIVWTPELLSTLSTLIIILKLHIIWKRVNHFALMHLSVMALSPTYPLLWSCWHPSVRIGPPDHFHECLIFLIICVILYIYIFLHCNILTVRWLFATRIVFVVFLSLGVFVFVFVFCCIVLYFFKPDVLSQQSLVEFLVHPCWTFEA